MISIRLYGESEINLNQKVLMHSCMHACHCMNDYRTVHVILVDSMHGYIYIYI